MKKDKRLEYTEISVNSVGAESMKKRIKKAHSMAKFAGALYLLGSIALFAFFFLPVLKITVGAEVWKVSIATFFDPIADFKAELSYNTVVLLPVAILYALMLVVGAINLITGFAQLSGLSKKNPTKMKGYNRNLYAMEKLGRCFSGTFITFIFSNLLIYSVSVAEYSFYVYIALGAGAIIHFLGGLVGGKIAYYDIEETVVEYKRTSKISVFFLRNLLQILATAAIVWFFVRNATLNGTMQILSFKGGWDRIVGDTTFLIDSCLQVALLVWLFVLINHVFHATEYNREGMKGNGMKNWRIFGFLTMGTAVAWLFVNQSLAGKWNLEILYIAIVAFAMFVLDLVIKSKKTGYVSSTVELPVAQTVEESNPAYHVALHSITSPGVFMQPNGQPVMVMPMQQGRPAVAPTTCPPTFGACPMTAPTPAPTPVQEPEIPFYDEWEGLTFEWDPDGKEREIACPYCGKKLKLKEGAPGYRCGDCGKVFQLKKTPVEAPAEETAENA